MKRAYDVGLLLLFTAVAFLVTGFHPNAEDAAIYVPAIKRDLNPSLYPFGSEFFMSHAHMTCFDELMAWSVRLTHLPLNWVLLLWQFGSIFLLLSGCLLISDSLLQSKGERWGPVAVVAAVLSIPVAGTSLLLMDPYVTPRSLSTPFLLLAFGFCLRRSYWVAAICLLVMAPIHPLMTVFGAAICILYVGLDWGSRKFQGRSAAATAKTILGALTKAGQGRWIYVCGLLALPFLLVAATKLPPVSSAYHAALSTRSYFFLTRWEWYEWIGAIVPTCLLGCLAYSFRKAGQRMAANVCLACFVLAVVAMLAGIVVSTSARAESMVELQPMRAFHPIYVLFFVLLGVIQHKFTRRKRAVQIALFAAVCCAMFMAQQLTFPSSGHIEWPSSKPVNQWQQAFLWIRGHTPTDAIFALDPMHMNMDGEDNQGFRAVSERSMLADGCKDAGAVTMFPGNAPEWNRQFLAGKNWRRFNAADLSNLRREFGVTWTVQKAPGIAGLDCPYQNAAVLVCKIPLFPRST